MTIKQPLIPAYSRHSRNHATLRKPSTGAAEQRQLDTDNHYLNSETGVVPTRTQALGYLQGLPEGLRKSTTITDPLHKSIIADPGYNGSYLPAITPDRIYYR